MGVQTAAGRWHGGVRPRLQGLGVKGMSGEPLQNLDLHFRLKTVCLAPSILPVLATINATCRCSGQRASVTLLCGVIRQPQAEMRTRCDP